MSSDRVDTSRPAFPSSEGARGGRKDNGSGEEKDQTTSTFEQQRDEALQVGELRQFCPDFDDAFSIISIVFAA